MGEWLIRLLVLVAIAAFVWWALRPRYDFTVLYENGDVQIRGHFPRVQHANLSRFLREDVTLAGTVVIRGRRTGDSRLDLNFRGPIDPGSKQQVRNFLTTIL